MPLFLVATPIGHADDISLRALRTLKNADAIIGEEKRVTIRFLKSLQLLDEKKELYFLNEHSKADDIQHLAGLAQTKNLALISDCGTPGFCDPGQHLVKLCRKAGIPISSVPGASSLMTLLSLTSEPIREFLFLGFLPKESSARQLKLKELTKEPRAMVIMDTPYRLQRTVEELRKFLPNRKVLLGLNLTQETEQILEMELSRLDKNLPQEAEFILLLYPQEKGKPLFKAAPQNSSTGKKPKTKN